MFKGRACGPFGSGGESGLDLEGGGNLLGFYAGRDMGRLWCGTGVEAETRQESIAEVPGVSLRA